MTSKVYSWGTTGPDSFNKVDMDNSGNIYAVGTTYSTVNLIDAAIQKFDYTGTWVMGISWGSFATEVATGVSVESGGSYLYVIGYTDSVGTLSNDDYDIFVIMLTSSLGIVW
jgi:precorrin-2 methylase